MLILKLNYFIPHAKKQKLDLLKILEISNYKSTGSVLNGLLEISRSPLPILLLCLITNETIIMKYFFVYLTNKIVICYSCNWLFYFC